MIFFNTKVPLEIGKLTQSTKLRVKEIECLCVCVCAFSSFGNVRSQSLNSRVGRLARHYKATRIRN